MTSTCGVVAIVVTVLADAVAVVEGGPKTTYQSPIGNHDLKRRAVRR
jgi:hypothetical protein